MIGGSKQPETTDTERLDWIDRKRLIFFMALRKVGIDKPVRDVIDELMQERPDAKTAELLKEQIAYLESIDRTEFGDGCLSAYKMLLQEVS